MASPARVQSSAATSTAMCALSLLAVGGAAWFYFSNSSSRRSGAAADSERSTGAIDDDEDEKENEDSGLSAAVSFSALLAAHLPSDRARPLAAAHPSASLRALRDVLLPPPCALPPRCEPVAVGTLEELRALAAEGGSLARARVVGVDVEHSSRASYLGKVCTIQLSCAVVAAEGRGNGVGGSGGAAAAAAAAAAEAEVLETLPETFVVDVVALCRRENEKRRERRHLTAAFARRLEMFLFAPSLPRVSCFFLLQNRASGILWYASRFAEAEKRKNTPDNTHRWPRMNGVKIVLNEKEVRSFSFAPTPAPGFFCAFLAPLERRTRKS